MEHPATALARDLAGQAERLCRTFLSNGRREGNYWLVGDIRNTPGRSLYVRLRASADGGAAGKWTDAQSGDHGDLLDIVRAATTGGTLAEAMIEARRFLSQPSEDLPVDRTRPKTGSPAAARRLIAITTSIRGTPVETYLTERCIEVSKEIESLRYLPRCWYRRSRDDRLDAPKAMPAMIATVTDLNGQMTGAHRTWLLPDGSGKAAVASPRRAMGHLLGNGVRFGSASDAMGAGEGIETVLSLTTAIPSLPAIAGLSAAHLAAIDFPPILRRLYVAREQDLAGRKAFARLVQRGDARGVQVLPLDAERSDLNSDLRAFGREQLVDRLASQMLCEDRNRLL